jgi:tryptophan 2,3-dioxygenase
LKDARYLKNYAAGSGERALLEARLSRPSLGDAFFSLLERRGLSAAVEGPQLSELGQDPRLASLLRLYREPERHYDAFLLAESLIEYDEVFALWRLHHVKMVERMIGTKTGTGGSEGAAYLKKTVDRRFFPELWELRSYLSKRASGI